MTKISKAYHLSLFAVALWAFTALLLTGEFNEALIAVCYALAGLAFLLHRRGARTPEMFWNGLTLIAFGLAVYLARQSLFDAAIYFFMYLQVARLFTLRRPTDARWLYLIAFFQIIGAAVLTTSLTFAFIFSLYVLLMLCSLMLFTITKDFDRVSMTPVFASGPVLPRAASEEGRQKSALRALATASVLGTIFIVVSSAFLFTLIPRLSTQRLFQTYGKNPEAPPESAFDESIEFGSFGRINLDNAVAMYVRPVDTAARERPDHIRLRGVALDTFNGRAWRRTTSPSPMTVRQAFAPFTRRMYTYRSYTIIQPPGITNYLFGDTFPNSLNLPLSIPYLFDPQSNSAWLPTMLPKDLQYAVTCRVERLEDRVDPEKLSQGNSTREYSERFVNRSLYNLSHVNRAVVTDEYLEKCEAIPPTLNANRIQALAREWTASASTPFERARAIEDRFRTQFEYTLEQRAHGNFIEDFLFRARAGHCEYFATSMAIMLRSLGIPARAVNGYYCTEWNNIANAFIVRQRDAHSWVEVYLGDDYGWMTFDPTPAAGVGRTSTQNVVMAGASRLVDALKVRWYRYVIDYSHTDQIGIVRTAIGAHMAIAQVLGSVQVTFGTGSPLFSAAGGLAMLAVMIPLVLVGLVGVAWILWRLMQGRSRTPKRRRRLETGIRFYRDILRLLARRGYVVAPGQTPREFARTVASAEPELTPLVDVTELYYATRFNEMEPTAEQLSAASRLLTYLRKVRPPQA